MDLETLHELTELKYQQSLAGLSKLLSREAALRAEIQRLRDLAYEAQALPADAHAMQNIGADVIWLGWVAKATRTLNIELAQVLAQKEMLLANQRRAMGRTHVAEKLALDARRSAQEKRRTDALERAIEIDLLQRLRDQ